MRGIDEREEGGVVGVSMRESEGIEERVVRIEERKKLWLDCACRGEREGGSMRKSANWPGNFLGAHLRLPGRSESRGTLSTAPLSSTEVVTTLDDPVVP